MNLKHRLIFCDYNVFTPQLIQYAHILHQIVCKKLRLILLRASQMTIDYGEGPWAPAEIFVGGASQKKAPTWLKMPPPPINVAENASTCRKSNKKAPK